MRSRITIVVWHFGCVITSLIVARSAICTHCAARPMWQPMTCCWTKRARTQTTCLHSTAKTLSIWSSIYSAAPRKKNVHAPVSSDRFHLTQAPSSVQSPTPPWICLATHGSIPLNPSRRKFRWCHIRMRFWNSFTFTFCDNTALAVYYKELLRKCCITVLP